MSTNPTFVRLTDAASRGSLADVGGTGWAISGNDVLAFPEDAEEARFVRGKIRLGVLEEASVAEHEEAHPEEYGEAGEAIPRIMFVGEPTHQEATVIEQAKNQQRRMAAARAAQTDELYGEDSPVGAQAGVAGGQAKIGSMMEGGFATPGEPSPGEAALQRALLAQDEDDDGETVKPYVKWKKDELVAEAANRDLDTDGTVKELAERLTADDESDEG